MPSNHESRLSAPIDLLRVRRLFSQPGRVRDAAFLLREIGSRMHDRLALVKIAPREILDAGCGEGADLASLQKRFAEARIIGVDAAPAMLAAAGAQQRSAWSALNNALGQFLPSRLRGASAPGLIAGDFANLPFPHGAFDLVWSNLALHWHPQPDRVFAEWRRVLRTEGLLMFCCFGPDTFREVRTAFAKLDGAPHVLPFVDMHDFGDMLVEAGFSTPVMDMETITLTYEDTAKLWADVRALGGNPLATRRRGLIGRKAWAQVNAALDAMRRADGQIPLTIEVIYGHAFRPVPRTTSLGESIIRFEPRRK
ncbi:MAG: methyltransferase domain-containing protein [Burkholderiaceae bacterium]|nr:methyltransferase domain-containing protein [Burkholderiaceae bacterium]